MPLSLSQALRKTGHLARRRTLAAMGVTPQELSDGLKNGSLWRPSRGWIADRNADAEQLRAVATGTRIGCVTALKRWGVWAGPKNTMHLHAATTASRLSLSTSAAAAAVPIHPHPEILDTYAHELEEIRASDGSDPVVHWGEERFGGGLDWIVSVEDALLQAVPCQSAEHAVACVDSALHLGAIDSAQWSRIVDALPKRLKWIDRRKDPRAGSGNETRARLRFGEAGYRVEPQFFLLGAGSHDFIVDDCVIVEVDSDAHHGSAEQQRKDRARMLVAQIYGLPTLRIGPESFTDENWSLVLSALAQQVKDAKLLNATRRVLVR